MYCIDTITATIIEDGDYIHVAFCCQPWVRPEEYMVCE